MKEREAIKVVRGTVVTIDEKISSFAVSFACGFHCYSKVRAPSLLILQPVTHTCMFVPNSRRLVTPLMNLIFPRF